MFRLPKALFAVVLLAACGADNIYAPEAVVQRARYVDTADPPYVTLFTVINNQNGAGAHSSLLINGSQRVLFDPAGSWVSPASPEQHDVHFGVTDGVLRFYIDYHARMSYRVLEQTLPVSLATADALIAAAEAHGSADKGFCAVSVTQVLDKVPEFRSAIHFTPFPIHLSKEFGRLAGVSDVVVYDNDSNDHKAMLLGNATGTEASNTRMSTVGGTSVIPH